MLALFMVLILKYLPTVLRILPLILMFQRRIRTSTMRLIKILLVVFQLELLKFVQLIAFCLSLILRKRLVKEHSMLTSVLNKSAKKALEPDEQITVKSPVAIIDGCQRSLTTMYSVTLPRNPPPENFKQLLDAFRSSQRIHRLIEVNLVAGANFALGWIRKWHPRLNYSSMSLSFPSGRMKLQVDTSKTYLLSQTLLMLFLL
jgi:hypothetical protein